MTGGVLAALSALHVAWGFGSSVPFRSRGELADAVVGTATVPPPLSCFAVAGALAAGAALASGVAPVPPAWRRPLLRVMAGVLGLRGGLGLFGKTDLRAALRGPLTGLPYRVSLGRPGALTCASTDPEPTLQWRLRRSCCDCPRFAFRFRRPAASRWVPCEARESWSPPDVAWTCRASRPLRRRDRVVRAATTRTTARRLKMST
jgi:hypothetical protein